MTDIKPTTPFGRDCIAVWDFPEADFGDWYVLLRECGEEPQCVTHRDYRSLLAAIQADQERQGRRVVRVRFGVQRMRDELARNGWANNAGNRAAVVGLAAAQGT